MVRYRTILLWKNIIFLIRLWLVADPVIQAIGRPNFEDGIRTRVQLEVGNDLQCVLTKPVVQLAEPLGGAKTIGAVYPLLYKQCKYPNKT